MIEFCIKKINGKFHTSLAKNTFITKSKKYDTHRIKNDSGKKVVDPCVYVGSGSVFGKMSDLDSYFEIGRIRIRIWKKVGSGSVFR